MVSNFTPETILPHTIELSVQQQRWLKIADELKELAVETKDFKLLEASFLYARAARGDTAAATRVRAQELASESSKILEVMKEAIEVYWYIYAGLVTQVAGKVIPSEKRTATALEHLREYFFSALGRYPSLAEESEIVAQAQNYKIFSLAFMRELQRPLAS